MHAKKRIARVGRSVAVRQPGCTIEESRRTEKHATQEDRGTPAHLTPHLAPSAKIRRFRLAGPRATIARRAAKQAALQQTLETSSARLDRGKPQRAVAGLRARTARAPAAPTDPAAATKRRPHPFPAADRKGAFSWPPERPRNGCARKGKSLTPKHLGAR